MLVVERRRDEIVLLDGGIEVVVVRISKDSVRLGFIAPKECKILREELVREPVMRKPKPEAE